MADARENGSDDQWPDDIGAVFAGARAEADRSARDAERAERALGADGFAADARADDLSGDRAADRAARRADERRRRRLRRTILVGLAILALVAITATVVWFATRSPDPGPVAVTTAPPTTAPEPPATTEVAEPTASEPTASEPAETTPAPSDNLALAGDIASPSSITVLVNKHTPLQPIDYVPDDLVDVGVLGVPSMNGHSLRLEAAQAVQVMFDAAAENGYRLDMTSGYRSYSTQTSLYNGYVESLGQAGADATSAKPGYSEHQTGLTADITAPDARCPLEQCFAETDEGQWLAANAWRYGFILRYPDGATPITGYEFEPWHFRYVGVDVSTAMHDQGIATYEEFLGLPAAPDYLT